MKYLFLSIFLSLVCVNLYSQDYSKEDESTDNVRLEISDNEDNLVYSISKNEFSRLNIIKLLVGGVYDYEDGDQKWRADEKTDRSKQKILETKILTPSFDDFKLKYPYKEK